MAHLGQIPLVQFFNGAWRVKMISPLYLEKKYISFDCDPEQWKRVESAPQLFNLVYVPVIYENN